jgi:glycosyltransferase involved in cell wall biosynthesis
MRKSILFLTQVLPWPLDAGPKTRAYYVLRALAAHHDVTLLSFVRATDTPAAIAHLATFCQGVHTVPMVRSSLRDALFLAQSLLGRTPFVIQRDRVTALEATITRLAYTASAADAPFDAVHADQLWMAPYALFARDRVRESGAPTPKLVLDQHNATYRIFARLAEGERNPARRALYALEARKLARYEVETCRRFDDVVWVTHEDVAEMEKVAPPNAPVPVTAVIPICIDATIEPPIAPQSPARRITFLGGLHYPPNAQGVLWFAHHVMPLVLAAAPDALLTVIGKQPPAELAQCNILPANLEATGYVDDPMPWLAETAAFIVPLLAGGGMRVKIIDGWRWGLPIVSTTVGAEGIEYTPGVHLLCADTPEDFAAAVIALLQEPARRAALASAGRAWVESHYHWRTVYAAWLEIYGGNPAAPTPLEPAL